MYYTCLESFMKRYVSQGRKDRMVLDDVPSFLSWQRNARSILSSLLGLEHLRLPSSLNAQVVDEKRREGVLIRRMTMNVEDDVVMPFCVLIPDERVDDKLFICPPGHLGGGKESLIGNREKTEVAKMIDFYGYDFASALARRGHVALAPDIRGFGERREAAEQGEDRILSSSCRAIAHMALPLGLNLMGLLVWDLMRLVDYCVGEGWADVHMIGFSGGGMQTLYACALDERIRSAFISGYYYGFLDSLLVMNANCDCNYVPGLWLHFEVSDLAAMIAPRPIVIQSAEDDHLAGNVPFINRPVASFVPTGPDAQRFPLVAPQDIDLVAVPLVAFDGSGNRLGYGAGNYDRYLPQLRTNCIVAGVAFEAQRVPEVPTEPHDRPLLRIISA